MAMAESATIQGNAQINKKDMKEDGKIFKGKDYE